MTSEEIRETFLAYFERQEHRRLDSASLVPDSHDPTVLLTTAGMQPLKPYFMGLEEPPANRLTSAQRCFRTTDIGEVGNTARHLTFFEMLGNFSIGDYFKREAIAFGWELSTGGFGFDPADIWVTVFEGDPELDLGPDTEAIEIWRELGVPEGRIVRLPRSENFWQAGPTGPCGPCSEMYLDRGVDFGSPDDLPGGENDRFLEYWNHVFMTYELAADGSLTPLPQKNIDTGMGLERMAAILQGVDSVYETDSFKPLVDLAARLSGRGYEDSPRETRAMRILADHSRGAVELIADGVVPSNEERGYILRRIMRRAIQQGRVLGLESPYLDRFAGEVIELAGDAHPHLRSERETILRWVRAEEESFGRTLERGVALLEGLVAGAKREGTSWIDAADAFELHDTYGFPYEMTKELVAEEGLEVDDEGFEELMEGQRRRARQGGTAAMADRHDSVIAFAASAPPSRFVGYAELEVVTSVAAATPFEATGEGVGGALLKLEESPLYPEGGGQVSDAGVLRWAGSEREVVAVYRVGDDQALRIEGEPPEPGSRVEVSVDRATRWATMRNHTATHLLHAALRELLGTHVRQAGSAVRPDKLRFDFTHGERLGAEEIAAIERRVNAWIAGSAPVLAMEMARERAQELGAMALFGEKYGEWVRMVEVPEVSRELCGGTHVANTAEVGAFKITSEGSSAANVRRIEAITGPAATEHFREVEERFAEAGELLGNRTDPIAGARRAMERLKQLEKQSATQGAKQLGERAEALVAEAVEVGAAKLVVGSLGETVDQREMLAVANRSLQSLGEAVVIFGGAEGEKVALVGVAAEGLVGEAFSVADVVGEAAVVVGGGGGGRPTLAQAGGRNPQKLDEALELARARATSGLDGD
ncbi:MAG: alanine--tRNA ligase [Solirubrobacterales bacterium]